MKIIRIVRRLPSTKYGGVGLPAHYHALFSKHENVVLKPKEYNTLLKTSYRVIEISAVSKFLEQKNNNPLTGPFSYIYKVLYQILFTISAFKTIHKESNSIVHFYSPEFFLLAIVVKKLLRRKTVLSFHGTDLTRKSALRVISLFSNTFDSYFVLNEEMGSSFFKIFNKLPIIINNGYDHKLFYNFKINRDMKIIYVANLRWPKNHLFLFNVFLELKKKFGGLKLVLIGDGVDKKELVNYANLNELSNDIELLGYLSQEQIAHHLNSSYIYIHPSLHEGFSKSTLEAMACGLPVISSRVGNASRLLGDDENCICEINDIACFIKKTEHLLTNIDTWKRLSTYNESTAKSFSWENIVCNLDGVYDGLTND